MKYRTLPIVAALVASLFIGCSKSGSQVQVISAVFGESTNFADVSIRVSDLLHLASGFKAQPTLLQADPLPYYHKTLVIIYEVKGRRHIFTTAEDGDVSATILLEAAKQ
jgi:hypothetical protein